jgi:hypothetical protein
VIELSNAVDPSARSANPSSSPHKIAPPVIAANHPKFTSASDAGVVVLLASQATKQNLSEALSEPNPIAGA